MLKCDENLIMIKRGDWVWVIPIIREGVYKVRIEDDDYYQLNPKGIIGYV